MKSNFLPRLAGLLLAVALVAAFAPRAEGQIIDVPLDQPTIAAGIAAAQPGWTVRVAPGVYQESLLAFGGKPVLLTGADPNNPPILEPGTESGFRLIETGETAATEVRDFIIRDLSTTGFGAGIEIRGSTATNAPAPIFRRVRVENCRAAVNAGSACVVENIFLTAPAQRPLGPTFIECEFVNNGFLSGIPNADQRGVVAINAADVSFVRCTFRENEAFRSPALWAVGADIDLVDSLIVDNVSVTAPSAITLADQRANPSGYDRTTGNIVNCTIAGNTQIGHLTEHEDTAVLLDECDAFIQSCIIAENPYIGSQPMTATHQVSEQSQLWLGFFDRCCITTGASSLVLASNLITASPAFVGTGATAIDRYRLLTGSPCLDAGSASVLNGFFDLSGAIRFQGSGVDVGALEGAFSVVPLYPGSGEDFAFDLRVNGALADNTAAVAANGGDLFDLHLLSPNGNFVGSVPLLVAQIILTGQSPSNPIGFPEAWIVPGAFPPPIVLFDGNAQATTLGPALLTPIGLSLGAVVSPSLSGIDFVMQGFGLTPTANNGFFASSEAYLIEVN